MENLEFRVYKPKMLSIIVACVFFLIACIYLLLVEELSAIMQILFIIGGIAVLVEMFRIIKVGISDWKDPQKLIISEDGIYSNMIDPEINIAWDEVSKLQVIRQNTKKKLAVVVNNPQSYLAKYKSTKFRSNNNNYHTPFVINTSLLKVDIDELAKRINRELESKKISDLIIE